jgi:hypothetical protein
VGRVVERIYIVFCVKFKCIHIVPNQYPDEVNKLAEWTIVLTFDTLVFRCCYRCNTVAALQKLRLCRPNQWMTLTENRFNVVKTETFVRTYIHVYVLT